MILTGAFGSLLASNKFSGCKQARPRPPQKKDDVALRTRVSVQKAAKPSGHTETETEREREREREAGREAGREGREGDARTHARKHTHTYKHTHTHIHRP